MAYPWLRIWVQCYYAAQQNKAIREDWRSQFHKRISIWTQFPVRTGIEKPRNNKFPAPPFAFRLAHRVRSARAAAGPVEKQMNTNVKLNMTLKDKEAALVKDAMATMWPGVSHDERGDMRRIVKLAILAYCSAVVRQNWHLNSPCVAELRRETKEEMLRRVGHKNAAPDWQMPNRWN